MKKLSVFLLVLFAGLAVCAYLVRQQSRRAQLDSGTPPATAIRDVRALDAWQGGIRLDPGTGYAADAAAQRRLPEKLRDQERKQPPQEGRK